MCHFLLGLIWGTVWACRYFKRLKMYTCTHCCTFEPEGRGREELSELGPASPVLLSFQVTFESLGKGPSWLLPRQCLVVMMHQQKQKGVGEKPWQFSILSWFSYLMPHQIKPCVFILTRCHSLFVFNEMICGVRLPFGFNINILLNSVGVVYFQ